MPKNRQNTKKGSNPPWRHTKDTQTYIEFCDTPQHCTDFYCGMSCRPFSPPCAHPWIEHVLVVNRKQQRQKPKQLGPQKYSYTKNVLPLSQGEYTLYIVYPPKDPLLRTPPNGRPFLSPLTIFPDWFGFLLLARRSMLQMSK